MNNIPTNSITVSKQEYLRLKKQAQAYRDMVTRIHQATLADPIEEVVADFKATNLYEDEFLKNLEEGLRQSSYAQNANKNPQSRS